MRNIKCKKCIMEKNIVENESELREDDIFEVVEVVVGGDVFDAVVEEDVVVDGVDNVGAVE